ncbi:MAG: TIGR02186 family protein [Sphingomonadaceae bacterium]
MKRLLLACALLLLTAADEPVLVPDVSQREVEILYSFTGAELLLFGAILYPGGRVPDGRTDIAVVLKGPPQSVIVREKQKLGGLIWANADSARFRSAPAFYAVATSRPLNEMVDERMAAIYELGLGNIHLSPASGDDPEAARRFESGLVELRARNKLFASSIGTVEITRGVLYRARLYIPARVPVGRYTAETFLIRDGKVLAAATRDVDVRKGGFERYVANAAVRSPLAYGILAVTLSVLFGWAAGALFRRF